MMDKPNIFIFDIDGTLASTKGPHLPMEDMAPNKDVVRVAVAAQNSDTSRMAIVTARPESSRKVTEEWIGKHRLNPEFVLMRKMGDERPDYDVRVDQVKEVMRRLGRNAILYDDKASNCREVERRLRVNCVHIH